MISVDSSLFSSTRLLVSFLGLDEVLRFFGVFFLALVWFLSSRVNLVRERLARVDRLLLVVGVDVSGIVSSTV